MHRWKWIRPFRKQRKEKCEDLRAPAVRGSVEEEYSAKGLVVGVTFLSSPYSVFQEVSGHGWPTFLLENLSVNFHDPGFPSAFLTISSHPFCPLPLFLTSKCSKCFIVKLSSLSPFSISPKEQPHLIQFNSLLDFLYSKTKLFPLLFKWNYFIAKIILGQGHFSERFVHIIFRYL